MKKNIQFLNILFAFVMVAIVFQSCKEDEYVYSAGDAFHFASGAAEIPESSSNPQLIPIIFSKTSAIGGNVTVEISSPTAIEGQDYVVTSPSTTFDYGANDYVDTLYIQPIDNSTQQPNHILNVVLASGSASLGYPGLEGTTSLDTMVVTIIDDDCPQIATLAGSYTSSTIGGGGDGSGAINGEAAEFTYNNVRTITEETAGNNTRYVIDDITMGLYLDGYGSSNNTATFDWTPASGTITIDMAASPDYVYGGDSFFGSGMAVDNCDGILQEIQLDWSNSYGDQGMTVLSPQ